MREVLRDWALIAWVVFSLLTGVWGLAQQTLVAQSQLAQRNQALQDELAKAKAAAEKKP